MSHLHSDNWGSELRILENRVTAAFSCLVFLESFPLNSFLPYLCGASKKSGQVLNTRSLLVITLALLLATHPTAFTVPSSGWVGQWSPVTLVTALPLKENALLMANSPEPC